jgi:hypothetical protein
MDKQGAGSSASSNDFVGLHLCFSFEFSQNLLFGHAGTPK